MAGKALSRAITSSTSLVNEVSGPIPPRWKVVTFSSVRDVSCFVLSSIFTSTSTSVNNPPYFACNEAATSSCCDCEMDATEITTWNSPPLSIPRMNPSPKRS